MKYEDDEIEREEPQRGKPFVSLAYGQKPVFVDSTSQEYWHETCEDWSPRERRMAR